MLLSPSLYTLKTEEAVTGTQTPGKQSISFTISNWRASFLKLKSVMKHERKARVYGFLLLLQE